MESGISWEVVRGIETPMVLKYFSAAFFSETEMELEGIVKKVLDERDADKRDEIIESAFSPIFNSVLKRDIYIYREKDHVGLHLMKRN